LVSFFSRSQHRSETKVSLFFSTIKPGRSRVSRFLRIFSQPTIQPPAPSIWAGGERRERELEFERKFQQL
jgi:hypothetical protein